MEQNEILAVLIKNLKATVPGVSTDDLDRSKSMMDVGANSLDVVEVVSATMRELQVKIPRDQLSKMNNVGDLVDALHAAKNN